MKKIVIILLILLNGFNDLPTQIDLSVFAHQGMGANIESLEKGLDSTSSLDFRQ